MPPCGRCPLPPAPTLLLLPPPCPAQLLFCRSATELVWPATKHQERCECTAVTYASAFAQPRLLAHAAYFVLFARTPVASRVHAALSRALLKDAALHDSLVKQLGLSVSDVRVSPDCLKAFILYESFTGQTQPLQRELQRSVGRLRMALGRELGARHVPRLEFRLDRLSREQAALEQAFAAMERERADAEAQVAAAREKAAAAAEDLQQPTAGELEQR